MRKICKNIVEAKSFEYFIIIVILVNCGLIGVETYFTTSLINTIQFIALIIFIIEIVIRYTASNTTLDYFKDAWNIFDFSIVAICLVPESWFVSAGAITTLRVLRVFRVLRLLKASEEIRLIVAVLGRSLNALFYNMVFFFIFLYLFAIIGVTLFKLPDQSMLPLVKQQILLEYISEAPNAPVISPDPYGNLTETMFTLFRVLTGEDWTDIRYNLTKASEKGLIQPPSWVITFYHVLWYIISVFLLLNLLVGAILNNYQIIMNEFKQKKLKQKNN
ncbi:MAG: transporter [Flavobacteriales bacterium]|nr:transporter [Flavobacteriales bacterium]|tara:strand:- start:410 stop:1234 length:825 start_codon:yes stop_codon:yes gene_type:complete